MQLQDWRLWHAWSGFPVKPPIPEGMGFQPFRPFSEALAGQACYNIPGLARCALTPKTWG